MHDDTETNAETPPAPTEEDVEENEESNNEEEDRNRNIGDIFSGLTPPPAAMLRHNIPQPHPFKAYRAAKYSTIILCLGMAELLCGFAECISIDQWNTTSYKQAVLPLWTGIFYILVAMTGFSASNSEKRIVILGLMVLTCLALVLSIAMCSIILPSIIGYSAENCSEEEEGSGESEEAADDAKCNEAHLVTALCSLAFAMGIIAIGFLIAVAVMCGGTVCPCCVKGDVNVFQEAPVFFRMGGNGEMEANIVTGANSRPIVVPLPEYDKVVKDRPLPLIPAAPPSPPPDYRSRQNSIRRSFRDSIRSRRRLPSRRPSVLSIPNQEPIRTSFRETDFTTNTQVVMDDFLETSSVEEATYTRRDNNQLADNTVYVNAIVHDQGGIEKI